MVAYSVNVVYTVHTYITKNNKIIVMISKELLHMLSYINENNFDSDIYCRLEGCQREKRRGGGGNDYTRRRLLSCLVFFFEKYSERVELCLLYLYKFINHGYVLYLEYIDIYNMLSVYIYIKHFVTSSDFLIK